MPGMPVKARCTMVRYAAVCLRHSRECGNPGSVRLVATLSGLTIFYKADINVGHQLCHPFLLMPVRAIQLCSGRLPLS